MDNATNEKDIKKKVNQIIFAILVIAIVAIEYACYDPTIASMPRAMSVMLELVAMPYIIIWACITVLPIFFIWLILQKFVFKKIRYTDKLLHNTKRVLQFSLFCLFAIIISISFRGTQNY